MRQGVRAGGQQDEPPRAGPAADLTEAVVTLAVDALRRRDAEPAAVSPVPLAAAGPERT